MLKISIINVSDRAIQFRLEGNLVGPWVEELQKLSDEALSQQKTVSLDLGKVWFVDARSIPSFLMRLRSVLGCRSRILAAPRSPSMTQSVFCSTFWMCRLSTCSSDEESPVPSSEW